MDRAAAEDVETAQNDQQAVDNPGDVVGGDPGVPGGDLARWALSGARGVARSVPQRRRRKAGESARDAGSGDGAGSRGPDRRGGYSGPGHDPAVDPLQVGAMFTEFAQDRGWERPLAQARVFADWAGLVGRDVAAHCTPQSLRDGELRVAAESTAWATQLRLLSGAMLARLVEQLGPDVVAKLVITGPTAPSWKHGHWSVRGGRGPRDTYG